MLHMTSSKTLVVFILYVDQSFLRVFKFIGQVYIARSIQRLIDDNVYVVAVYFVYGPSRTF